MASILRVTAWAIPVALLASGCAAPKVDFASLERPVRAAELDAFNVFVGDWDWEAEMVNGDEGSRMWSGTAKWDWTLDDRCLRGMMSSKSGDTSFDAAGTWSWHPKQHKYIWSMFNSWGYPQEGTACYDDQNKCWQMNYKSVGLDGSTSHGRYIIRIINDDKLEWSNQEWVDPMHLMPKLEMKGTYTRRG